MSDLETALAAIERMRERPEGERVEAYNAVSVALGALVRDFAPDPAASPRLVQVGDVDANDYNPNRTASPELDLLEVSMREDGITMAVVVVREKGRHVVVDGFHRRKVAAERLGRRYLPCAVIESTMADRMASTIRHNRARGKHQVDLMATLVREMMTLGWDDEKIAGNLGMTVEELLRLRQIAGAARMLASDEYTREWQVKK